MKTKLLVVWHGSCDDGFGAAWAIHQAELKGQLKTFWPDGVEYVKGIYGVAPPEVIDRDVVLVDFCYSPAELDQMIAEAKSVLVLDHHVSAMKAMVEHAGSRAAARWETQETTNHDGGPMTRIVFSNGSMEFDMGRSGAAMAWDHFHNHTHWPKLISYIQDRDLWTKKLRHIDEFTMALRSYPMDFKTWDQINDLVDHGSGFQEFVAQGHSILRYQQQLVDQAVKASYWAILDPSEILVDKLTYDIDVDVHPVVAGTTDPLIVKFKFLSSDQQRRVAEAEPWINQRVRVTNCIPALASEVGEALAKKYGCIGVTWIDGKDRVLYSLRSRGDNAPDVSEIAKAFGGGGHAKAAGFKSYIPVHGKLED